MAARGAKLTPLSGYPRAATDYGLPASYPMVAETYSARRRDLAKQIGLGRKPGESPKKRAAATLAKTGPAPKKPRVAKAKANGQAEQPASQ